MRTRRWLAAVAAALLLGLLLRVGVHLQLAASDPTFDEPLMDGVVFLGWAARIAAGDLLGEGAFFFNPLYAYALAPVVAVFGDGALAAARVIQGALGLATVLLVASTTRRLLGRRASAVAAFLAAAWPVMLFLEGIAIGAALGVFVNALALDLLARWRTRPTRARLLGAGAALGFAVLGRPNAILVPLALPPWLARALPPPGRARRAALAAVLLLAGTALPLLPSLARNLAVLGEPVVTTTSMGVNLHLSNNPLAWETGRMDSPVLPFNPFLLEDVSRAAAGAAEGRRLSPTEASSWWTRRALQDCGREPGRAALFLLRKGLYFCGSAEIPSSESFAQARRDSPILRLLSLPLAFGWALPLAAAGAAAVVARRRRALPLVLVVAVYAFGLVVFFPLSHYRAPVLPALLPLAAAGAVALLDLLRGRGRGGLPAPLLLAPLAAGLLLSQGNGLAGAAGVPSLGPFPEPPSWVHANRAQALVERAGRREAAGDGAGREADLLAAEGQARLALAGSPEGDGGRWLVLAAFARIARQRGDLQEELRRLEEALALRPGQAQLLADRGWNLLRRGRREEALRDARAAAEGGGILDPGLRALLEEEGR